MGEETQRFTDQVKKFEDGLNAPLKIKNADISGEMSALSV
jgi:hypothetical protein